MYWHPITYDPVQYERTRGQETRTLVFCKCSVKYELFLHHDGEDKFRNHEPTITYIYMWRFNPGSTPTKKWDSSQDIPGIRFESLDVSSSSSEGLSGSRTSKASPAPDAPDAPRAPLVPEASKASPPSRWISRRSSDLSNARNREELATKKVWKSVMNLGILLILFMET